MPPAEANDNVPDHTMKPSLKTCTTGSGCHTQYTGKTFDVLGGQTSVKNALIEMQAVLNTKGWLTRSEVGPYPVLTDDRDCARQGLRRAQPPLHEAGALRQHQRWALLGAIVSTPGMAHFFKLTGPAKTLKAARPELDDVVTSLASK